MENVQYNLFPAFFDVIHGNRKVDEPFPFRKHRSIAVTLYGRSLTGLIHTSIYRHGVNSIVKC